MSQSSPSPARKIRQPTATHQPRGNNVVPLGKIFATQKEINTRGRIVHVDFTPQFKEGVGQWMSSLLRGHDDLCFTLTFFGASPKIFEKLKSLNGKVVDLFDVNVAFAKGDAAVNNPFSIIFSGPHSRFGKISDFAEAPNDALIMTTPPSSWTSGAMRALTTSVMRDDKTAPDFFDDFKVYPCDDCAHGSAFRCPKTGRPHPQLCKDCGLLDCDSVVPFCGRVRGKRHKPDPSRGGLEFPS